jgi:hypothetical protein
MAFKPGKDFPKNTLSKHTVIAGGAAVSGLTVMLKTIRAVEPFRNK